jgi:hypothetical protein
MRAESARSRETRFRAASEALLAGTPDAETRAIAKELNQQATAEGRAAKSLESESASLLRQQAAAIKSSDALIARAVKLETASP